ncbi:hypothetical protein GF340_03060 [Candidatus Peregrinibacteria bacterium]|nr:hypothetical protein [Candidatus Peregrinibacteria bacterium]
MQLQPSEQIIRVFRHHYFSALMRVMKIIAVSIPFYLVSVLFAFFISTSAGIWAYFFTTLAFVSYAVYDGLLYYYDRLVITNVRVIHVDWKGPFQRFETEARLTDIQDMKTLENGILSYFKMFDFGDFKLETASSHTTVHFRHAPDPEGIRNFIYHLNRKTNKMNPVTPERQNSKTTNDQSQTTEQWYYQDDVTGVTREQ